MFTQEFVLGHTVALVIWAIGLCGGIWFLADFVQTGTYVNGLLGSIGLGIQALVAGEAI